MVLASAAWGSLRLTGREIAALAAPCACASAHGPFISQVRPPQTWSVSYSVGLSSGAATPLPALPTPNPNSALSLLPAECCEIVGLPCGAATALAALASKHAADPEYMSPYTLEALEQGQDLPVWEKMLGKKRQGGKLDDITVVVAQVVKAGSSSRSG